MYLGIMLSHSLSPIILDIIAIDRMKKDRSKIVRHENSGIVGVGIGDVPSESTMFIQMSKF